VTAYPTPGTFLLISGFLHFYRLIRGWCNKSFLPNYE